MYKCIYNFSHHLKVFVFISLSVCVQRYIKDTNVKNKAEDLNALINKLAPEVKTWTPRPGAVLDLSLALKDSTNRLSTDQNLQFFILSKNKSKTKKETNIHKLYTVNEICSRSQKLKKQTDDLFSLACCAVWLKVPLASISFSCQW